MPVNIKKSVFFWILAILFVLNVSAISTIFYQVYQIKQRRPDIANRFHEPREFFRNKLNLENEQLEWFLETHEDFKRKANPLFIEMQSIRDKIFKELTSEEPDYDTLLSYSSQVGELTWHLNKQTIDHFLELRENCTPVQQKLLNRIILEIYSHGPPPSFHGEGNPGNGRGRQH